MQARGIKPTIMAYGALAHAFAQHGDWIRVEGIARDMARNGIIANDFFLNAQLLSYARAKPRQVERAEACFRSALKLGIEANDHIVSTLARVVGRPRCIELVKEL